MLSLILAAWRALGHPRAAFKPELLPWRRRAARIEPATPWPRAACAGAPETCTPPPCALDSTRALQLLMLQRLAHWGERWAEMKELGIDGTAPLLLDAMEQLADHRFVRLCVSRPQGGRATVLAARRLPKGVAFLATYAAHAPSCAPVSAVPTGTC
jgi:hypothetical protein